MITKEIIKKYLSNSLERTNFNFGLKYEGKVRDNYDVNNEIVMVTTDRISAFDLVWGTIPLKGQVLNELTVFWFNKTKHIIRNHLIQKIDPNVVVVNKCKPYPVEMVVRGYITGVTKTSLWYNYSQGQRIFNNVRLPDGLKKNQKLSSPIITPTTKAQYGKHDKNITKQYIIEKGLVDKEIYEEMERIALELFKFGTEYCEKCGLLLVDTKYEFGELNGELVLIDEIHTPDSSRFWLKESYESRLNQGMEPEKLDKEFFREWLISQGINTGIKPKLNDEIKIKVAERYIKVYELIIGEEFKFIEEPILERIKKNLISAGYLDEKEKKL